MTQRSSVFGALMLVLVALTLPRPTMAKDADKTQMKSTFWRVALKLDTPHLDPPAVQYAVFDKDPVPGFIARVQRSRRFNRQQLEGVTNPTRIKSIRGSQMSVGWDFGFEDVTGDEVNLLTSAPGVSHSVSANSPAGRKWIVAKTVRIQGKPTCWCIPFEAQLGQDDAQVTLSESNTFDLEATFDKAMSENTHAKQADSRVWRLNLTLDTPHLDPPAVQYAVFDKDPVPAFIERIQSRRAAFHEETAGITDPAHATQNRGIQMSVSWNRGFRDVSGISVFLLTAKPGHSMSSNRDAGTKWFVTKTVNLQGKPTCWCIPFEAKQGEGEAELALNESNAFDLATTFDKAMAQPTDHQ